MQGNGHLFPMIRHHVMHALNGYVADATPESLSTLVREPGLGGLAGPLGAAALACCALE